VFLRWSSRKAKKTSIVMLLLLLPMVTGCNSISAAVVNSAKYGVVGGRNDSIVVEVVDQHLEVVVVQYHRISFIITFSSSSWPSLSVCKPVIGVD
jgi:hypothetical protein